MSEGNIQRAVARSGCLISIVAALVALVIFPAAKWLFWVPFVYAAILTLASKLRKDPSPSQIADAAEGFLNGETWGWDVDDYEHLNPRNPAIRELWAETLRIGGLPEEWMTRDEATKQQLRNIIAHMRNTPHRKSLKTSTTA